MNIMRTALAIVMSVLSLTVAGSPTVDAAQQEAEQKKVLVVYSSRRETRFATIADRELPRLLEQRLGTRPDFYSEHMDAVRFPEPQYQAAFHEYLALKYRGIRFDVIIAFQSVAFDFIARYRDELFPGTPIVFMAEHRGVQRVANSAGVLAERDYGRTLALITALQPDTTQVFVVTGSSDRDKVAEATAKKEFASVVAPLTFTYLSNLSTEDLERRVATLPEHSVVYYLLFYQDAGGTNVNPVDYLDRLATIANRPIYSWIDSTLNRGIVGGSLLNIESQVAVMADLATRVLRGERADAIPFLIPDLHVNQVDWRQLQRWNISEARVPAGTIVRFQEPGVFARYKGYIFTAAALLLAQTALIAGLWIQCSRRRRAEEKLRANQAELSASYHRVRDLGGRLIAAQEAERTRVARELHDDIGQQLTLLALDLELLNGAQRNRPGDVERLARSAVDRVHDVSRSVHDMSYRLHPSKLRLIGLVGMLGCLQREQPSTMTVSFAHHNLPDAIPPDLSLCMYRIAQEAVQNATKHGGARRISMHLAGTTQGLALTITDDGAGFDVPTVAGRGLGLISMSERLEPFGGALNIQSTPGRGTRVEAVAPWPAPAAAQTAPSPVRALA